MPTIEQIRAARALLDWSQSDLADHAGLSQTGIARIENGTNRPNSSTIEKINNAFDRHDIEFISDSGVKKRTDEIRVLRGQRGFTEFLKDVQNVASQEENADIRVSNVDERNFDQWFGDIRPSYMNEMTKLKETNKISFRILVQEGDKHHIAQYADYRWVKEDYFGAVPFYVYGDKMAIVLFKEDDVAIFVINNKEIADAQRMQFDIAWKNASEF